MASVDCDKSPCISAAAELEENGFVVIKAVISNDQLAILQCHLKDLLMKAIADDAQLADSSHFATIHTREHRHDLRLPMNTHVLSILKQIIGATNKTIYNDILSPMAKLVELGVIASHPGAQVCIIIYVYMSYIHVYVYTYLLISVLIDT